MPRLRSQLQNLRVPPLLLADMAPTAHAFRQDLASLEGVVGFISKMHVSQ